MLGPYIGRLATGEAVFGGRNGHFATHAAASPELSALVVEALGQVDGGEQFITASVDLGRVVGATACVPTTSEDDIVFARRPSRHGLTRFVRGRQPVPTQFLAVILRKSQDGYELLTSWVGELAPHEPWDRHADLAVSIPFWSSHALVWGVEETIPGTETTVCPW